MIYTDIILWICVYIIGVLLSMQPFYIQGDFYEFIHKDKFFTYWFYSSLIFPYVWFIIFWVLAVTVGLCAIIVVTLLNIWIELSKYVKKYY